MRIAIIGGGIIGCLTACYLKRRGAEPIVIERGKLGQEASWAGAGILCPIQPWLYPDVFTELVDASLALYPDLQQLLHDETGQSIEWRKCGLLIPFFEDDKKDHWQQALNWSSRFNWHVESLSAKAAIKDEPCLNQEILNKALLWPEVAQLRNPRLLQAVRLWMEKLGIEVYEQTEVASLIETEAKVSGIVCANGKRIEADHVLLASGSWSGELAQSMGIDIGIQPVKGQILLLKGEPNTMRHIVKHDDAYFVPRTDGRVLVGASMEAVGFERGTTADVMDQLLQASTKIAPGLKEAEIEQQWMGFRPGSVDGLPFLGPVPQKEGLWIASGHYRNGVALAPITAEIMSNWIVGNTPDLNMSTFAVDRDIHSSSVLGIPAKA
ncbi:MAG: glycine oxidase ThiO [Mariprofundaceae bacterium]